MKPVIQTIIDDGKGNCWQAAVASILEMDLDDVPHFVIADDPEAAFTDFLASLGLRAIVMRFFTADQTPCDTAFNHTWIEDGGAGDAVLLSGFSPRMNADGTPRHHAVVGRSMGYGFEVIHDPHPSGEGIVGQPFSVRWIVPLVSPCATIHQEISI